MSNTNLNPHIGRKLDVRLESESAAGQRIPLDRGCFELKSADDLLAKAKADLKKFRAKPDSSAIAFNLLATLVAWPNWFFEASKPAEEKVCTKLWNSRRELSAIRHLADNAKHWSAIETSAMPRPASSTAADAAGVSSSSAGVCPERRELTLSVDGVGRFTMLALFEVAIKEFQRCLNRGVSSMRHELSDDRATR